MPKLRYIVLIQGRVQKGGFRSFIKKHALMLGLKGYAENLEAGEVIIVAEGEKSKLDELLKIIEKEAPAYIKVENITKKDEKYLGFFSDFERRGSDLPGELEEKPAKEILSSMLDVMKSTDSKLEVGVERLGDISKKQDEHVELTKQILKKQDAMLDKQDTMLDKQDELLGKQDAMLGKQDAMLGKQDTMIGKMDLMLGKQDETISVIREEGEKTRGELKQEIRNVGNKVDLTREELKETIKDEGEKTRSALTGVIEKEGEKTREVFKEHLGRDIEKLYSEINEIKATLSRVVEKVGA